MARVPPFFFSAWEAERDRTFLRLDQGPTPFMVVGKRLRAAREV